MPGHPQTFLVMVAFGVMTHGATAQAAPLPTMPLLDSVMVTPVQTRRGGFDGAVTRQMAASLLSPAALMEAVYAAESALQIKACP